MNRSQGFERALAAARAAAANHRHAFVGAEHLLAGLLDDPSGLTATLLGKAGHEPTKLRGDLLSGLRRVPDSQVVSEDQLPVSRMADQIIDAAVRDAKAAGRHEVTDRDLFAALLATPKGRVSQLLKPGSPTVKALRDALGLPARSEQAPPRPPAAPAPPPRGSARPKEPPPRDRRPKASQRPADESPPVRAVERRIVPIEAPRRRRWWLVLILALPASFVLSRAHGPALAVFLTACISILPLAALMGEATEALAERTGPTIGGLLNATFGNAAELIIAIVALRSGLIELVKASITGSILGNLLLILGLSCIAAGSGRETVRFSRTNAGMSAAMLALAVIGLVFPALFHATQGANQQIAELHLSEIVAVILIITYGCSLLFSLKTHRALFGSGDVNHDMHVGWRFGTAIGVLAVATIGIVFASELLVHAVEGVTEKLGLSQTFLGLIIIPIVGNAAEHATAVVVARKGQMDLAFQIALGSSTQIALLVAPLLVFAGLLFSVDMNLVFPTFEVLALAVSVIVISIITLDGETHWFEGFQLLAVYGMLAAAAFFI